MERHLPIQQGFPYQRGVSLCQNGAVVGSLTQAMIL